MVKVGIIGRFPPENIPFATYLKNLVDNLNGKCEVVTIGLRNSDCNYIIDINKDFSASLEEIIEKEKIDVLHIQYIASSEYFAQTSKFPLFAYLKTVLANIRLFNAMKKIKIPVVVTLHELNRESKNLKQLIVRWLEKKVIDNSDKIIVHSSRQKSILSKENFNAQSISFGLIKKDVVKEGGTNLLYLATIYPSRGLEYLIRSMKLLPEYKLVIKGPATDKSYSLMLQSEIKKLELNNISLEFDWGTQEERDALYRQADIVVLPYLWAPNQSAALHDAFSYRTPVVVTDTNGPIDETVREFNCGVVVEMGNPEKIAEGVKTVHRNYKKFVESVDKYREIANWDSVANQHIEIYNELKKGIQK